VLEAAAAYFDGAFLFENRAELAALRARLLLAQTLGLLPRGFFQCPCRHTLGRSHGHLFHLGQIDIEPRSFVTERPADGDFSPALGQLLDVLQILGR
jgi:hypothetical protein